MPKWQEQFSAMYRTYGMPKWQEQFSAMCLQALGRFG